MRLTREADYAVRIVLDLTGQGRGTPVRSAEIARRQIIPRPFLTKVVQALAREGYVRTRRGTGGGITLARDPAAITLRDVVEAVEGPIRLNRCLVRAGECALDQICPVHPVWKRIQDYVIRELDGTTFASLTTKTTTRGGTS